MRRADQIRAATRTTTDRCIPWEGATTTDGYGILAIRRPDGSRTTTTAHRAALVMAAGPPPMVDGQPLQAAHKPTCNNRRCINPRHLYWATPQENSDDQLLAGTRLPGARVGYVSQQAVAKRAGVAQSTVSRALSGHPRVGAGLRLRVLDAVVELGYEQREGWGRPAASGPSAG